MSTAYQKIAKSALMKWYELSEEEANYKIENESVEELESQVDAKGSIQHAIMGIAKECSLSNEDAVALLTAVVNGPENAEILAMVADKAKGFTNTNILNLLSAIHDGWVKDNSSEKTFQKKVDRKQLRQYAPLELIGWNEAKSDLLFLSPILESIGVPVDEKTLEESYHERAEKYMSDKKIGTKKDLVKLLQQGREYYEALPEDLAERLTPVIGDMADQMIDNWKNKDPQTAKIMSDIEKKEMSV